MNPIDDQIMEILAEEGGGTPKLIAEELDKNNDYVGTRCRELVRYGLLVRPSVGVYRIAEQGIAYLNGDLDASELKGR